jgi:hypothetical protein
MKSREFPIRAVKPIALSLLVSIFAVLPSTTLAAKFSDSIICGDYGLYLNGWITTAETPIPTWATAVMTSDGKGRLKNLDGTFNVGGCVIVKLGGKGTYSVAPNGTGTAAVTAKVTGTPEINTACGPSSFDPSLLSDPIIFDFALVSIGEDAFKIVGTSWKNKKGESVLAFGSNGRAEQQEKRPRFCDKLD